MKTGEDGMRLIKHFEDCVLRAYPDPATGGQPWTIGIGHTGAEVRQGDSVTLDEAYALLAQDLVKFETGVNAMVLRRLEQTQFDALISLSFNIGLGNFKGSTLLRKLNAGEDIAAQIEFLKWNRAAGKVMKGLQRRRKAESLVFGGALADAAIEEALRTYP
jgi:lysozyme